MCQRRFLSHYLDSTEVECSYFPGCELCDVCKTDELVQCSDNMDVIPDAFFDISSSDEKTGFSSLPQTSSQVQIKTIAAHQLITAERILDASLFEYCGNAATSVNIPQKDSTITHQQPAAGSTCLPLSCACAL